MYGGRYRVFRILFLAALQKIILSQSARNTLNYGKEGKRIPKQGHFLVYASSGSLTRHPAFAFLQIYVQFILKYLPGFIQRVAYETD
jgi:hypothetical protein